MGMDENHETIYQRLCERLEEMPEVALKREFSVILVLLPHHDYRKDFSARAKEVFLDFGYAIDRCSSSGLYGDEFELMPCALSAHAARGKAIHVVYMPSPEGLQPNQKKILSDFKEAFLPVIKANPNSEIYEY